MVYTGIYNDSERKERYTLRLEDSWNEESSLTYQVLDNTFNNGRCFEKGNLSLFNKKCIEC